VTGLRAEPPYLIFDIGGGSTEFVTGSTGVEHAISMDIGCVRMTERYLHDDPPTAAQIEAATRDIAAAVDTALAAVPGRSASSLVGLAGTVTTVTALALGLPEYDSARIHHARVSRDSVAKVTDELLAMTVAARLALPVMHPGRADVIGGGALILRTIMERAGQGFLIASEHDILDGIAVSIS
jgi:exopolyphosphatase/guanosine-5'-triphosphate,3'-diphosphate pyrophosphatase